MTAQGHARSTFNRAIQRRNVLVAEATAREIGRISLDEALALTILVAERAPSRFDGYARRWLKLYMETNAQPNPAEVTFVANCLSALTCASTRDAASAALTQLTYGPRPTPPQ